MVWHQLFPRVSMRSLHCSFLSNMQTGSPQTSFATGFVSAFTLPNLKPAFILRNIFYAVVLSMITLQALIIELASMKWSLSLSGFCRNFVRLFFGKLPVDNVRDQILAHGYDFDEHKVQTSDGFILGVFRLKTRDAHKHKTQGNTTRARREAVLMQHGLLNTCLPFVQNGKGLAPAFILADQGFDVWLGNNRCNKHSRKHVKLDPSDDEFWNWAIDDLAIDVEAMVDFICNKTGNSQLTYIGHSQGAAQGLEAFSTNEKLCAKIKLFVCLSPGAFVKPLTNPWLKRCAKLHVNNPSLFFSIFGRGCFAPPMEWGRKLVPHYLWSFLGQCMFLELFDWSTALWDKCSEPLYFQETPSCISVRNVAQWLQQSESGRFCFYDFGAEENMKRYGTEYPPDYPLENVTCPTAVFHGGKDLLIDFQRLIKMLPNVVLDKQHPQYYHLDNMCAPSAVETVFPEIIRLIKTTSPVA
eukprot:GILK01001768.1.p1 GENE.GILK01001768.1~~GILK01001768.1.p1  ORF type:complete len:468 (-),score=69.68 GILK01001768.1:364-1767(-)